MASQARIRGRTLPPDLVVAPYIPLKKELAAALLGRDQPADYYDIVPPPGIHLECPTLDCPAT